MGREKEQREDREKAPSPGRNKERGQREGSLLHVRHVVQLQPIHPHVKKAG
jgi:hypothetical protein